MNRLRRELGRRMKNNAYVSRVRGTLSSAERLTAGSFPTRSVYFLDRTAAVRGISMRRSKDEIK